MELLPKQTLCFLTSMIFACVSAHLHAPEVHTELGSLRGQYMSVKGMEAGVHAFLGVPFAKPPVSPSLRLAAPQPVEGWKGVRDATQQPLMCIQNREMDLLLLEKYAGMEAEIPEISEDCLYLNIYTPANRAQDAKLPVMVWIHGGSFTIGSASFYDGSALSAYQDVVVVPIQYRLGLLGFLSTGDENVPGNFGLLDQIQALRWIQQHIHNFGGNPDLVTIFGESAGGMSVSLLLLSPLSEGLVHRAIAESGSAAMDFLLADDPLPFAQALTNTSGCSLESTKTFGDCIRNLDSDTIVTLSQDPTVRYFISIDGHFLKKPVPELFHNHDLLKVPFMTGVNNDEGGYLLLDFLVPANWTEGLDLEQVSNILSIYFPNPKIAKMGDLLIEEYIGNGEDRVKNRNGLAEIIGDMIFTIPALKTANAHRDAGATVYLYQFQHAPYFLQKSRPSFVKSDHGDEIVLVFGYCFTTAHVKLTEPCPKDEEQLSRTMMSYWANFARSGSPNGDGLVHWPKYTAGEDYMAIGIQKQEVAKQLKKNRFIFLTEILPEKMKEQTDHSEL